MPGGNLQNDDGKSHAEAFGEVEQQQETGGQPDIPRGVGENVLHRETAPDNAEHHHGQAKSQRQQPQGMKVVQGTRFFWQGSHSFGNLIMRWGVMQGEASP